MNTAQEKINLASWILGQNDESIIQKVSSFIAQLRTESKTDNEFAGFTSYRNIQKNKFDLERLKIEQNIKPINKEELNALIKEADIPEPIEELLEALD